MIRSRKILKAPTIRIIPIIMMLAVIMLGARVYDIVIGGQALQDELHKIAIAEAKAADDAEEEDEDAAAEDADGEAMAEEGKEGEEGEPAPDKFADREDVSERRPDESKVAEKRQFNNVEVDLLQSLAERREKLDIWEEEVAVKEKLLEATERRLDTKLAELKDLQGKVQALLNEYQEYEEEEIKSLVKIYESMKPKDAAIIFNKLDMPILFKVVDMMSERRAAPILAKMDANRARDVTRELAAQREMRNIPANVPQ